MKRTFSPPAPEFFPCSVHLGRSSGSSVMLPGSDRFASITHRWCPRHPQVEPLVSSYPSIRRIRSSVLVLLPRPACSIHAGAAYMAIRRISYGKSVVWQYGGAPPLSLRLLRPRSSSLWGRLRFSILRISHASSTWSPMVMLCTWARFCRTRLPSSSPLLRHRPGFPVLPAARVTAVFAPSAVEPLALAGDRHMPFVALPATESCRLLT